MRGIMNGNGSFNIFRLIVNIVCFAIAGIIIVALLMTGALDNMKEAIPFYIAIVIILAGIPAFMALGNRMIIKQDSIIEMQTRFNQPVKFSKRSVILGYGIMFSPLYLFILGSLLIPFEGGAWAIFFIPASVITFVLSKLKGEMLAPFKISKLKYRCCHLGAYAICVLSGILLRIAVILPYIESLNG